MMKVQFFKVVLHLFHACHVMTQVSLGRQAVINVQVLELCSHVTNVVFHVGISDSLMDIMCVSLVLIHSVFNVKTTLIYAVFVKPDLLIISKPLQMDQGTVSVLMDTMLDQQAIPPAKCNVIL